jgi:hypothetical protein
MTAARDPRVAVVAATFDVMKDALDRRDGDTFVACLQSLRAHVGDEAVDGMVTELVRIGSRRMIARMTGRQGGGA